MQGRISRLSLFFVLLEVALCASTYADTVTQSQIESYSKNPLFKTTNPTPTPAIFQSSGISYDQSATGTFQKMALGKVEADRAIAILKDQEMKKALTLVTERGYGYLQENPELQSPVFIIASAASLWAGKTFSILKLSDTQFSTRVTGRERSGSFNIHSPILNGQLKFDQAVGAEVSVNRSISSIDTRAEFAFSTKKQAVSSQFYHSILPNLDLSFGASQNITAPQVEGTAKIQYQIDF